MGWADMPSSASSSQMDDGLREKIFETWLSERRRLDRSVWIDEGFWLVVGSEMRGDDDMETVIDIARRTP